MDDQRRPRGRLELNWTSKHLRLLGRAELLGLAQRTMASAYQRRYPAVPRPMVDLGQARCKLWLRSEIEAWQAA